MGPTIGLVLVALLWGACSAGSESTEKSSGAPPSDETVVARYADASITLAELDSAFVDAAGSPQAAADSSLHAYRNFLDRYLNYHLKVRAALDAGMDTLPSVRRDVHNYRLQRTRPLLLREEVYEPLARTLYERRSEAVDVSHILIRPNSSNDTLAAYRTAQAIADSIERGVPFGDLAIRNSDDPAARKKGSRGYRGRLGYLRAGQTVAPFENRMYTLEAGETSDVFRTTHGYHILKVHDRRPAEPPVKLAHVLRRPRGDTAAARHLLDSLRTEILEGRLSFAAAARKYSHDQQSAAKGGSLGELSPQALPPPLRRTVATLDSVNAISGVVESRFGVHLLKLTGRQERQSFDEAYDDLKDRIAGQPRTDRRKAAFARRIRADVGTTVDTSHLLTSAHAVAADSLARPLLTYTDTVSHAARRVATLGDSTYTVAQMGRHLMQTDGGAQTSIADLIESFLNEKAIQYAATRRALNDPAVAREVKTYRDGTLLFRFMQDSVWTAATRDTAGLHSTYRENRGQYRFPERVRTLALRAPADSLLRPYATRYERGSSLTAVLNTVATDSLVSADTVYVTNRSADVYQPVRTATDGETVGPIAQEHEWLFLIRDTYLPPRRKRFEEARSQVVQDHRARVEERILRRLRVRYDAETFPERLRPPTSADFSTP